MLFISSKLLASATPKPRVFFTPVRCEEHSCTYSVLSRFAVKKSTDSLSSVPWQRGLPWVWASWTSCTWSTLLWWSCLVFWRCTMRILFVRWSASALSSRSGGPRSWCLSSRILRCWVPPAWYWTTPLAAPTERARRPGTNRLQT